MDLGVLDRDDTGRGGHGDRLLGGVEELAGEGLMAILGVARADLRLAADVAAEMLRLRQRALGPGARHLERILLADLRERLGHALAQIERHALGVIDEEANKVASDDLREQDLNLRFRVCKTGLDIGLDIAHVTSSFNKKAGSSPASQSGLPAAKSLFVQVSTGLPT